MVRIRVRRASPGRPDDAALARLHEPATTPGLAAWLQEIGGLARRSFIQRRRERLDLAITIALPGLWLVFFGLGMGRITDARLLGTNDYLTFALPAIIVMTVVSSGIAGSMPLLWDRETGYLQRLMSMPIARSSVLVSRFVLQVALGTLQMLVVITIGLAAGAQVKAGVLGIVVILASGAMLIVALTALFGALAYALSGHSTFLSFATVATFPLLLTSNAFVPLARMPDPMRPVAQINPLTYAIDAMRTSAQNGLTVRVGVSLLVVALFSSAATAIGIWQFRRVTNERAP